MAADLVTATGVVLALVAIAACVGWGWAEHRRRGVEDALVDTLRLLTKADRKLGTATRTIDTLRGMLDRAGPPRRRGSSIVWLDESYVDRQCGDGTEADLTAVMDAVAGGEPR